jgi:hypothetical protein
LSSLLAGRGRPEKGFTLRNRNRAVDEDEVLISGGDGNRPANNICYQIELVSTLQSINLSTSLTWYALEFVANQLRAACTFFAIVHIIVAIERLPKIFLQFSTLTL